MLGEQPRASLMVCEGGTKARNLQDRGVVNGARTVSQRLGEGQGGSGRWRHCSMRAGDARGEGGR